MAGRGYWLAMIKVLWIIDPLVHVGGVETLLLSLAGYLGRRRFSITLCTEKKGCLAKRFKEAGVGVVEIPRRGKSDAGALWALYRFIQQRQFDIVHTHGQYPGISGRLAGWLARSRIVSSYHAALHEEPHHRLTKWVTRLTLPLAHKYIFVSQETERSYFGSSQLFSPELWECRKSFTIYNGIDVQKIADRIARVDPRKKREEFGLLPEDEVLVTIGRLTEQKGQVHLVKAMRLVVEVRPRTKLLIIGEGELRPKLEQETQRQGLSGKVHFVGVRDDVFEVLKCADLFVLPSLWEGLPMTLLEAMAVGTPVVATAVTGVREVIESEVNGLLVPSRNPEALVVGILKVLQTKEWARQLADRARAEVQERFSMERMAQEYEQFYEALVDSTDGSKVEGS